MLIDAICIKIKSDVFCNDLIDKNSQVFDFNGDIYSCIRLIGTYTENSEIIKECNTKNRKECEKCWAKNFCRDCVVDVILNLKKPSYKYFICYKKFIYKYALKKLFELYHSNEQMFYKFIEDYNSFHIF